MLTALNLASDINSGTSYTLIAVVSVVMGGAALIGGVISPLGAVAGAVTLTLIGSLLGMLSIPSNLNLATQGLLLLIILAVRSLSGRWEWVDEGISRFRPREPLVLGRAGRRVVLDRSSFVSGRWSLSSLSGIVLSASFLTCVALGQMQVVTTGRGNIDLSVAGVLTLSAFLALVVIQGQDGRIWLGLLAALGLGRVWGS